MPKEKNSCTPASVGVFFTFFFTKKETKKKTFKVFENLEGLIIKFSSVTLVTILFPKPDIF